MPASIDATVGGASANSYVTLADANTYFDARLYSTDWTSATDADKTKALIMAAKQIDLDSFVGYRTTVTQALRWPRYSAPVPDSPGWVSYYLSTEIPQIVKDAQCEYALLFLGSDYTAQSDLTNYKKVKVGPIEIEMNQPIQSGVIPAEVARLLRDLRTNGSGAQMIRA